VKTSALNRAREQADSFLSLDNSSPPRNKGAHTQRSTFLSRLLAFSRFLTASQQALTVKRSCESYHTDSTGGKHVVMASGVS
jgi:hypothetical protein